MTVENQYFCSHFLCE